MTFFYDLNKKLDEIRATPSTTHGQLNERDMGKHNNATTGFAALAKKAGKEYGSKAAGERVAGAVKAKMAKAGKLEEQDMEESAFQAAIGKKKYGDQGMKALQKAGRDHASAKTMSNIRNKYDKYDESMGMADEGNEFSGELAKAKAQHRDQFNVDGKTYPVKEAGMGDVAKKVGSAVKKVGGAVLNKLGHGSDEDMRQDLQRKMGVSPTGKKPDGALKYAGKTLIKHVKDPLGLKNEESGAPMTAKQKSFAKLAPPADKITFADKIAGAKKEVDEMLGDVAAEAIKSALSPKQKKIDMNKNGKLDANDFAMLRKGGKQETDEGWDEMEKDVKSRMSARRVGDVTHGDKHDTQEIPGGRRVTRRVDSNTGYSVGADSDEPAAGEKRGRGRPKGAAKGPERVTAKATKHKGGRKTNEGDLEITDRGEYDQEGSMAKDDIHTIVRHARALEKILGDNDNLPEWVQAKLAKIEGMMTAVDDYMQDQKERDVEKATGEEGIGEESTNKRDNRAEKAGRKVTKDIEYDEKKKDGIHGKKRGSEDAKAEKAGKKVAKDIEYDEKKKKVKEAGGTDTPTASSGFGFGQGIYDSMNRELESMIAESMNISMSMNTDANGGPSKSITVTATDDDALKLGELLKNAGLGGDHDMVGGTADVEVHGAEDIADKIRQAMGDHEHAEGEVCDACGQEDCGCEEVDEAYGDDAVSQNQPDFPSNTETSHDAFQYSGGLNKPKASGMATIPVTDVVADGEDRFGKPAQTDLARLREMAGIKV